MPCKRTDCHLWNTARGDPPYVAAANPDISGIGVLVGFGASAFLTLVFCIAYYLIDDNASTRPARSMDVEEGPFVQCRTSNTVDQLFRTKIATFFSSTGYLYSERWSEALQGAVLLYSDQQSLTGIAILVSGLSQLHCSLATYHWQLAFDLAWFSSMTHLTTLTCLRHYFHKRPALRAFRMIYMAITALMLAISLGSTGFISPNTNPSFPALCLFRPDEINSTIREPYGGWYIGITLGFLVISYLTRVIQLFPETTDIMQEWFRVWPRDKFQTRLDSVKSRANHSSSVLLKAQWAILHRFLRSLWCILEAMADLWSSLLWEITWLLIALIWGTIRIVIDRQGGPYGDTGGINVFDEDLWGFGQVVAVLLLVAPFVSFIEVSYEALLKSTGSSDSRKEGLDPRTSPETVNAVDLQRMHSTDHNTAIDRRFQSIRFPRHRSTRRIADANDQVINGLPGIDDPVALQDIHNTTRSNDIDRGGQPDFRAPHTQRRLEFYRYRWFQKLILLIYCLSLAVAGSTLATFLAGDAKKYLKDAGPALLRLYAIWMAINLGIIWVFAIIGVTVSTTDDDPMPQMKWITPSGRKLASWHDQVMDFVSPAVAAWVSAIIWNGLVLGITAGSYMVGVYIFIGNSDGVFTWLWKLLGDDLE